MRFDETTWPGLVGAVIGLVVLVACADRIARAKWRRRWIVVAALACATLSVVWSVVVHAGLIEPRTLVTRRVEVVSEHWSGAPLRIGVISDTHVPGPHADSARVARVVAAMNRLRPDIVVLLGDYVGEGASRVDRSARIYAATRAGIREFSELNAPLGIVAVLGNRDRTFDRAAIVGALEEAGIVVAQGRAVPVSRRGGDFTVIGLANERDAAEDMRDALSGAAGGDRFVISHSPEPFTDLPDEVALMLAGHTHCGQVSVPFFGRPITHLGENSAYACHTVIARGHTLYTTAGVGTSGLPVRFLNPPEIVLITLRGVRAN